MSDSKTPAYDRLNERQKRFVDSYLRTGNATESAREAGYKGGKGKRSWVVMGSENLTKPDVKAALEERGGKSRESRIMGAEEALERLSSIARGSVDAFLDPGGNIDLTTPEAREALRKTGAKVTRRTLPGGGQETAVEVLSVVDALKSLLKRYGGLRNPEETRKQSADARAAELRAVEGERKERLLSLLSAKLSPAAYQEVLAALALEEGPADGGPA